MTAAAILAGLVTLLYAGALTKAVLDNYGEYPSAWRLVVAAVAWPLVCVMWLAAEAAHRFDEIVFLALLAAVLAEVMLVLVLVTV